MVQIAWKMLNVFEQSETGEKGEALAGAPSSLVLDSVHTLDSSLKFLNRNLVWAWVLVWTWKLVWT